MLQTRAKYIMETPDEYKHDKMYVFVAGYRTDEKEHREFEWKNLSADFPVDKVFVVNRTGVWYHDCFNEIYEDLLPVCEGHDITFIGASAGGYAALIFAHQMKGDSVTFGPQTLLPDARWKKQLKEIRNQTNYKHLMDISFIKGKQHHIYYGEGCIEDKAQAERMDCCLHPMPCNGHNIAQFMKQHGVLKTTLERKCLCRATG